MSENKPGFSLVFAENLRKTDANLSNTRQITFDSLDDFIQEREKIKRALEQSAQTQLKVDYSNFSNHVFFDSAVSKFDVAQKRILNNYPYNGTSEDLDNFFLTSSDYENYILESWPRYSGYVDFNGTSQYILAADYNNGLYMGSSSIYISAWIKPYVGANPFSASIIEFISGSGADQIGWCLRVQNTGTMPQIAFLVQSASLTKVVSFPYSQYTGSFNNIAGIYDKPAQTLSLYINGTKVTSSSSIVLGPLENKVNDLRVAKDESSTYYSGSIADIRVCHTASELFHQKNYNRPIYSEDYVKLYYKFNEGTVGLGNVDSVVVDYSKNSLHGLYTNYSSTNSRVSGAVFTEDYGDPILYSMHPDVIAFSSSMENSASYYDKNNNNLIFNLIPEDVLVEDEKAEGLLQSFALAMARFFDEIKLYIDQFDNLKITNYDDKDECPDLFLSYMQRYFGWKISEQYASAEPPALFFGEGVLPSGSLDVSLIEIKNEFWRRTLNNLPYLLKTKGKRYNLDAYFNVLGINKENINIKEYGYLPGSSIENTRVHKEKVTSLLGFYTGSLSASFVQSNGPFGSNNFTVETFAQLPHASSSYALALTKGSIWQFVSGTQSYAFLWSKDAAKDISGKFILTSSDGQCFSSSNVEVFDGDFVSLAAGLKSNQTPFIEVRTIDNDIIDLSASFSTATVFSGVFTGSDYRFIMGATSGTLFNNYAQGFYGQYRLWSRDLTKTEIDNHAYHFENVGIDDPLELPNPLVAHWALDEEKIVDSAGTISPIVDLSRNGYVATGNKFSVGENPYQKFLIEYNFLSPSVDLKWTENKVRVRNKEKLKLSDVAKDTNELSLEFNLIDALNRDISKIFSTFDLLNNAIGEPINKYRDEYADLEAYRRLYFNRLGDSIHFSKFFDLFKWFDKKISDAIKQLLPARVRFIGGEQVIESHFLERPRYGYKYPIFHTPVTIPEANISASANVDANKMVFAESDRPAVGTFVNTKYEENKKTGLFTNPRDTSAYIDVEKMPEFLSKFSSGEEKVDRNTENFCRLKTSGDQIDEINNSWSGVNDRNEFTIRTHNSNLQNDVTKLGNGFVSHNETSVDDQEHYFTNYKKYIDLEARFLSGTRVTGAGTDNMSLSSVDGVINMITNVTGGFGRGYFVIAADLYTLTNINILTEVDYYGSVRNPVDYTSSINFVDKIFWNKSDNIIPRDVIVSFEMSASFDLSASFDTTPSNYGYPMYSLLRELSVAGGSLAFGGDRKMTLLEGGWRKYEFKELLQILGGGNFAPYLPRFNLKFLADDWQGSGTSLPLYWQIATENHTGSLSASFRNVKFTFIEPLSDYGTKYFTDIDNQNIDFYNFKNSSLLYADMLSKDISEFPHYGGIFQMKNMVLGVQDTGKTGNTDDSIVQVNHIGSVVKVLWPPQADQNTTVKGFGDSNVGQRIGKLSTTFVPGDFLDVTEFDHMTLYCYLQKQTSGSMDDVIINIERRPLKGLGFTSDQAVSYVQSGSFATEARLTDIPHKKAIDYGDLSIREIGFPIDVPLVNTREIRVSCKHANGQSDESNRNFICYARFVKRDKNIGET